MSSLIQQAEQAHESHQRLVYLRTNAKKNFILQGRELFNLKQNNLYKKAIGEGLESWEDYLKQPELGLSKSEAERLIQIYEKFVLFLGYTEDEVSEIPVKALHYLLPVVKKGMDKEKVAELVESAKSLSQNEFKEAFYDAKNESDDRTYSYLIMKKCNETGNMTKVHGVKSELIKSTFNLD